MGQTLLESRFLDRRAELSGLVGRLGELTARCGRTDLEKIAAELAAHALEPFLFVVVGEVKTGKSSLINALLGADVTDVAPDPCTDRIRVISRGAVQGEVADGPLLVRVTLDNPILDGLAIVDTPGVDSIIDRHQEITEAFIPRADLVLFVFSALNPYSRSAWEFYDLAAEAWRRNVAFALTQADLATPEQIAVNTARLRELAAARGMSDPTVFLVSATQSRDDPEAGGIEALRRHIRALTASGGHFAAKLEATRRAAERVLADLGQTLEARGRELVADEEEAARIAKRLDAARLAAGREAEVLRTRVEAAYARLSGEFEADFARELTFGSMIGRSLAGLWRRKSQPGPAARLKELGEVFARALEREVDAIARQGAQHVFESVTGSVRMLLDELRRQRHDRDLPADALSAQRDRVLAEAADRVEALLADGGPVSGIDPGSVTGMDPKAALGGALVVLGTIFVVAVKSTVIDVTGGVVAALGAFLAGSALFWQRPRVLAEMRRRLAAGGERLRRELDEGLAARVDRIFRDVTERFEPFFADIAARRNSLEELAARREALAKALADFDPAG